MNDLASGTSSWSTKLVHGGLRYLEYYEFRLVREALIEREILWQIAPHIIRPLRFVLPHHAGLRPAWLLRLGLFLYDHIGGRHLLAPTRSVDLSRDEVGKPLVAIPYQDDFTLIGTTDRDYHGDPSKVNATSEEIKYLCESVSEYLAKPVRPQDVVWTYAGVRPLYDDGASEAKAATRDYVFELDTPGGAPLLSIYGGKITTYRRLAEEALERLSPYLRSAIAREGWTGKSPLPGGDMDVSAVAALSAELTRSYPFLTPAHANRLAHAYGTRATKWLGNAKSIADLGQSFGATLTANEVSYLMASEWALTAEDIVWRRSKLGLRMSATEIAALDDWIAAHKLPLEGPLLEAGGRT